MRENDLHVISRFRKNIELRYLYTGKHPKRRGRRKRYDGYFDINNIDFSRFESVETVFGTSYTAVLNAEALKIDVRVVICDINGEWKILFSTDTNMEADVIAKIYEHRFQIEFAFRDSKQFLGLGDCQSRNEKSLDFALNAFFSTYNLAKLYIEKHAPDMSIDVLSTLFHNIYTVNRIFSVCRITLNKRLNDKVFKELLAMSALAA